jgi:hypothetical protein
MMLIITTQYKENYGDAENPYWKFKGGCEYKIVDFMGNEQQARDMVEYIRNRIEYAHDMAMEYIIDWAIKPDDYLTQFERDQLEFEGKITYPAEVIETN